MRTNSAHFRTSADGDNWGDFKQPGTLIQDRWRQYANGTPYIAWSPWGGPNGTLLVTGRSILRYQIGRVYEAASYGTVNSIPSFITLDAAFEELADFAHVLVLPVSSQVSASAQAARIAAETPEAGGRVTVLDGLTVSAGTVLLAQGLQRLLDAGTDMDELEAWFAAARDRVSVLIYVDTLEFLRRGGRIGRTSHVLGGALGVRPLLTIRGGRIEPYKRALGRAAAMREFDRFLRAAVPDGSPASIGLAHADDATGLERLREIVQRSRPQASIDRVCEIGAVVGTHGGPGTLGMLVLAGE